MKRFSKPSLKLMNMAWVDNSFDLAERNLAINGITAHDDKIELARNDEEVSLGAFNIELVECDIQDIGEIPFIGKRLY